MLANFYNKLINMNSILVNETTFLDKANNSDIERLFATSFFEAYNTYLLGGGQEPEYIPASQDVPYHRIIFRQDYFASALHEVAHWCIAGRVRRLQQDYGYWYAPDGRSVEQQAQFELLEVKPQALEWCL